MKGFLIGRKAASLGLALVFAIVLGLAGCGGGGDSTTIIQQTTTVTEGADASMGSDASAASTTASSSDPGVPEPPADYSEDDYCGTIPSAFEDQNLYVFADGLECEVAQDLSKQAMTTTSLPSVWSCSPSTILCTNTSTGSSFVAIDGYGPGEQKCPEGQVAVGDDACAPAKESAGTGSDQASAGAVACGRPGIITGLERSHPGYRDVKVTGTTCYFGKQIAAQWIGSWQDSCYDGCTIRINGATCTYGGANDGEEAVVCGRDGVEIRFELSFFDV